MLLCAFLRVIGPGLRLDLGKTAIILGYKIFLLRHKVEETGKIVNPQSSGFESQKEKEAAERLKAWIVSLTEKSVLIRVIRG